MKTALILLVILAVLGVFGISQAQTTHEEEITLSTYYPAPYGEYEALAVDNPATTGAGEVFTTDKPGVLVVENAVGIGTPDPKAILDVSSTKSGLLPPRMTTSQLSAIAEGGTGVEAEEGSIAYNTDTKQIELYNGISWVSALGGGGGGVVVGSYVGNGLYPQTIDLGFSPAGLQLTGHCTGAYIVKTKSMSGGWIKKIYEDTYINNAIEFTNNGFRIVSYPVNDIRITYSYIAFRE